MKKRQKVRKGLILVSFFLFPAIFYYLSPILILQASAKGMVNGSFIIFLLLFLSALFLGRAYCGWLCQAAGCQEAIFLARDKSISGGDWLKWLIWIPWIGTIIFFAVKAGGYTTIDFFYQTQYGLSVSNVYSLIVYYFVLFILVVLPAFFFGKRAFCHHICWMAPFMILGRKLQRILGCKSLTLKAEPNRCKQCHTCTENCPMSLPVEQMVKQQKMEHQECILCGTCVDGCKRGVIRYYF